MYMTLFSSLPKALYDICLVYRLIFVPVGRLQESDR